MAAADDKGTVLTNLARRAIEHELGVGSLSRPRGSPWLDQLAATFVTIEQRGDLRGCIGSIEPDRPLFEDVTRNARAAAFRDPRFPPLRLDELETIELEVSLLSMLSPMPVGSEQELHRKLVPGVHGVLLRLGHRQATFLPSVWDQLPTPEQFLSHLKRKGGIPASPWSDDIEVLVYTVDKFVE